MIFKYKGRTERVTQNTEQDLTNGIIKVVSGQQRRCTSRKDTAKKTQRRASVRATARLAKR